MKHLKSKISRLLVFYIVLFSSVVTLCLTSIQLYVNYIDGIESLHQKIEQIELTNIESINQSLWTMDSSSVEIQLNGLTRINDIIYTKIVDENNQLIHESGTINTKNTITKSIQLKKYYRKKETNIGVLTIVATKENLYQHLINTVFVILISQAIKTFLVSIFIILLFYNLITRHLKKIADHAEKIELKSKSPTLRLDRKEKHHLKGDELERLADSINIMSTNIYNSFHDLIINQKILTEREAKFSAMFDSITDAIVFVDENRKIIQTNKSFSKQFGYELEEVKDKTTQLLYAVPEQYHEQGNDRYNADINLPHGIYEIDYRRKDGSIFTSETMGGAINLHDGTLLGFIGIIRDITTRKQAEEENRVLQSQLQQAQKMDAIGQLTGGIAHDFNNILASILGYSELMTEQLQNTHDKKLIKYIENITNAGERARTLVAQLLSFSRSAPGDPQAIYLPDIVDEVANLIKPTIPSSIKLRIEENNDTPNVFMDITQIHQILMNLFINARDAMDGDGAISVSINHDNFKDSVCSSCKKHFHGDFVKLTVKDTGTGIHKDMIETIFDPFKSTKNFGEGAGMGLSVVHGILHKHKSHIIVETEAGAGTSFHLFIPPYYDKGIDSPNDTSIEKIPVSIHNDAHILVVDDEEAIINFLQDLLETYNYKVTTTSSSLNAIKLVEDNPHKFDLIITDQTMPEMTGYEMAKNIFKIKEDIPIILCSGYNNQIGEKEALKIGCRKYLSKPINNNYLVKSIQEIISTKN